MVSCKNNRIQINLLSKYNLHFSIKMTKITSSAWSSAFYSNRNLPKTVQNRISCDPRAKSHNKILSTRGTLWKKMCRLQEIIKNIASLKNNIFLEWKRYETFHALFFCIDEARWLYFWQVNHILLKSESSIIKRKYV